MRIARSKSLPMPWTRVGVRLIPKGHSANRSLSAIEPVSATAKRKLENGEQRPVPEIYPARAEIPKITGQRLGSASVTRGNVAGSHTPGNNTPETRLPGCPERIRTLESRDAAGPWQRLDRKQWGYWRLIFIAERSGLQRRLERHCRRAEIWAGGSIRDLAPLAMVPLRGFGGGGAWCRCNRKGSSNVAQQNPQKDQVCARQEPRETACETWEHDPQRDQAGGRPRPAQTAEGDNDRRHQS